MRAKRWTAAALACLAAAVVPGALRLVPPNRSLDRAPMVVADPYARPEVERPVTVAAAQIARPVAPEQPPVPIAPPPRSFTGAPAPVVASAQPFRGASYREPGAVYALVIGIDDYPGGDYDLKYGVSDANSIDSALAGFSVPAANRVVLRNGQAQRAAVVSAIQALVDRGGSGSTIVLAFAGHIRKVDGDTEEMITAEGATIRDYELAAMLAPARASRMWVLLASCYAGGFTEILRPGMVLTAAADADSLAYESSSVRGSYLVHHMVTEGWLEGQSGPSVQSAYRYAIERMQETNRRGHPVQYDVDGSMLRLDTTGSWSTDDGGGSPGSGSTPPPPTDPDDEDEDEPERDCTLLVLCRRD